MDISAIALSVVAAAGTLTPLLLGLLNYFKDKKKQPEKPAPAPAPPAPAMGETVDFESVAVQSLNAQIAMLQGQLADTKGWLAEARAERDAARRALTAAGLPIP